MSFCAMRYGTVFRNIQHNTIDIMTEHEKMFSEQGIKIKALIARVKDEENKTENEEN